MSEVNQQIVETLQTIREQHPEKTFLIVACDLSEEMKELLNANPSIVVIEDPFKNTTVGYKKIEILQKEMTRALLDDIPDRSKGDRQASKVYQRGTSKRQRRLHR